MVLLGGESVPTYHLSKQNFPDTPALIELLGKMALGLYTIDNAYYVCNFQVILNLGDI